jgi:hypothetical protein
MYTNSCSKCSITFETKNPKRMICPDCLHKHAGNAEPAPASGGSGYNGGHSQQNYAPEARNNYNQPQEGGQYSGANAPQSGGNNSDSQDYSLYSQPFRPQQGEGGGGYQPRPYQGQQQGGYGGGRPPYQGGGGGYQQRSYQGGGGGYQQQRPKGTFIPPHELAEIEKRYKVALPLPNPDIQDTIGKELNMHPKKVFAGINLIRLKMKLPKLDFPKRPLAVTPDQLTAIQTLYEPYITDPPIGIHKIIAKQLRIDEWRVHVGIKLVRKSHNMPRWNEERADLPEYMKEQLAAAQKRMDEDPEFHEMKDAHATKKENDRLELEAQASAENAKPVEAVTNSTEAESASDAANEEDKPKKRGRPKKEVSAEETDDVISVVGVPHHEAEASLSVAD